MEYLAFALAYMLNLCYCQKVTYVYSLITVSLLRKIEIFTRKQVKRSPYLVKLQILCIYRLSGTAIY